MRLLLAGLTLCAAFVTAAEKPHIAVLTLEGDATTTPEQRSALSDRLQGELIKSDVYVVLDRDRIDEILKEQGFQQSVGCDAGACQVEMGRLLGVEKLVSGKVVNFDPAWSLAATMTDVATGRIEQSVNVSVKGKLFEVLEDGCPSLAKQFSQSQLALAQRQKNASGAATSAAEVAAPNAGTASQRPAWKKWAWVGGLAAVGSGSVIYALLQDQVVQDEQARYEGLGFAGTPEEQLAYDAERADAQAKADDASFKRNVALGLGAALLAGGVAVTLWF